MPTYDYECAACGHKFELFEKVHDTALKPCAKCGARKARRLLGTGAGVIFKGSGFHVTDYRKHGSAPASSGGAEPAKKKTARKEKEKKD